MTPNIMTFTGKVVNPLDVQPGDLNIMDIAHALSNINRFNGHVSMPISVAQHSVFVAKLCPPHLKRQALLHDASEAYLGDVTKWLKASPEFAAYREAEDRLQTMIFSYYGCPTELAPEVDAADITMVRWEAEQGFGNLWRPPNGKYGPITQVERLAIEPWNFWSHDFAKAQFLLAWTKVCSDQRGLAE